MQLFYHCAYLKVGTGRERAAEGAHGSYCYPAGNSMEGMVHEGPRASMETASANTNQMKLRHICSHLKGERERDRDRAAEAGKSLVWLHHLKIFGPPNQTYIILGCLVRFSCNLGCSKFVICMIKSDVKSYIKEF